MRALFYYTMTGFLSLVATLNHMTQDTTNEKSKSIYDYSFVSLQGDSINLKDYKGKKILFVNVASKCGFTPQYEGLQKLHEQYGDKLAIIGFPCNQFGSQESGTHEEIESFCQKNYGVEFLLSEKIDVKGEKQHPVYSWLTDKDLNGKKSTSVKWNFQKYMVDENGNWVDYWFSTTKPLSNKIVKHLQ